MEVYVMGENTLKIRTAIIWVVAYFGIMLFYTFLNVAVWRMLLHSLFGLIPHIAASS
jgi:hypothetical protein